MPIETIENHWANMKTKEKQQKNQRKPVTTKNDDNQNTTHEQLFGINNKGKTKKKTMNTTKNK